METFTMAQTVPPTGSASVPLHDRRLLLRSLLGGPLVLLAACLAGCGTRKDLPEERRTRGKFGHRGD
jgi:hypothetical protein